MHYLIRLRKILLSNYLYLFLIVIGTIYILINTNLKTNSKYKINDHWKRENCWNLLF